MQEKRYGRLQPTCNTDTVIDGRGGIFTWLPEEPIHEFNMLYFVPGASRGDHYHPEFTEYFLVVEGSGIMVYQEHGTKKQEVFHMSKGDCVFSRPGVSHAFHAITNLTAVALLTKPWDSCDKPIIRDEVTGRTTPK
jgi:mannose-6-phosphate isomerase-like protein (cupin superfamily)